MRLRTHFIAIVLSSLAPTGVCADPITVTAIGTLERVRCGSCLDPILGFGAAAGDPFSLRITFDSEAPVQTRVLSEGVWYQFGRGSSTLVIAGKTANFLTPDVSSTIINGGSTVLDSLSLSGHQCTPRARNCDLLIGISAQDPSGRLLSSSALPDSFAAVFNAAPGRLFSFFEDGEGSPFALEGTVFAVTQERTLPPVPEPGTLLLFGTGVAAAVRRREQ